MQFHKLAKLEMLGGQPPSVLSRFSPDNLSQLRLWLDATRPLTITRDELNRVSQWDDATGNGIFVNKGVTANQPITDTVFENRKNTIYFNTNDSLLVPSSLYDIPNNDLTIFVAAKQDSAGTQRIMSAGISGSSRMIIQYTAGGNINFYNNSSFDAVTITGEDSTKFHCLTVFKSGSTQSISFNGVTPVTDSAGVNVPSINQFNIGTVPSAGGEFFDGSVGEILIYDRGLSALEISQVELYLCTRWGVAR